LHCALRYRYLREDGSEIPMEFGGAAPPGLASVPKFEMRLALDTDGAALAAYRQNVELLYRLEFEPEDAARFYSHAVTYLLPHSVFARVQSVAQTLRRGPAEIARGGDQIGLYVQVEGELEAVYAGVARKLRAGDVAIIDYSREIESRATDFHMMYLMVPRDRVPMQFLNPAAHGALFPAASSAGQLLYRAIETLLQTADGLTLVEAGAAVEGLLAMTAGLLEGAWAREAGPPTFDNALLEKAVAFIDRELASPDLAPARLEAELAISRSGLYRLFEPLGGVRAAILQRRLDRAMRALLAGTTAKPPLRAIARDHGFQNEMQFARAFRIRHGIPPSEFYDMVQRKDHAALAALAERAGFGNLQAWIEQLPGRA
jgi:AraC-like DNA-binding protein